MGPFEEFWILMIVQSNFNQDNDFLFLFSGSKFDLSRFSFLDIPKASNSSFPSIPVIIFQLCMEKRIVGMAWDDLGPLPVFGKPLLKLRFRIGMKDVVSS